MLTEYGLPIGLIVLMAYMTFIVWRLGKDSNVGRCSQGVVSG